MQLVWRVTSEQAAQLGPQAQFVFNENGGSIGRSAGNDWVLPDATKTVSGCHAVIRFQNGLFTITDTSTNGVFINNEEVPLGRNQTAQLQGGETIVIGRFQVVTQVHGSAPAQATGVNTLAQPPNGTAMQPPPQLARQSRATQGNPFGDLSLPNSQQPSRDPLSALSGAQPPQHQAAAPVPGMVAPPANPAPLPPASGLEFPMPDRPGGFPGQNTNASAASGHDPLAGLSPPANFRGPAVPAGNGTVQQVPPPPLAPVPQPPSSVPQPPAAGQLPTQSLPDSFSVDDLLRPRGTPAHEPPAPPPMPPVQQQAPPPPMPPQAASPPQPPMPPAFDVPATPVMEPAPLPPATPSITGEPQAAPPQEVDLAEALSNELMADLVALSPEAGQPAPEAESTGARQTLDPITMLRQRAGSRNTRSSDVQTAMRARTGMRERLKPDRLSADPAGLEGGTLVNPAPRQTGAGGIPPMPPVGGSAPEPPDQPPSAQPLPPLPASASPAPGGTPAAAAPPDGAFLAFWRALGIDPTQIPPENRAQIMGELGHAIKETAEGLVSILQARRMIKDEFRLEQTTLQAGENNPLKFFKSGADVLDHAVVKRTEGFMTLDKAVQEGFQNMKEHEMAAMAGMQSAITGVLSRLSPTMFESEGKGLLGRSKDKAWERFVETHERMSGDIEATTREVIAGDVSNAYERGRGGR